jgi:PAS domain S-box-containing protein
MSCRDGALMSLKRKVWLWLSLLIGVILSVDLTISYIKLSGELRAETEFDARTVYGFMMATRRVYQNQFIDSELPLNEKTVGFLPAYSFSRISKDFANWNDSGVLFNNVTDQPRNPGNQADAEEMAAMAWFRQNPKSAERMERVEKAEGKGYMLYTAPIWIEPVCLKCHGDKEAAPPSIRDNYDAAYGYKLGELRGVASIKIPTAKFDKRFREIWGGQVVKSLFGYAILLLAVGYLLEKQVTRRIARLQAGADRIAEGDYATRLPIQSDDEICRLAEAFNRMADGVQSREQALIKLTQAVEQSPESIVITDLQGRIEYVNAYFVENSGYSFEELLGKNPRILQSGKTPAATYQAMWVALKAGNSWQGEFINRRKDGSEYVEFASVAVIRQPDGQVSNYLSVKQDITEKKRIASELDAHRHHLEQLVASRTSELTEARQRADEANQAKSAFLANMSHEIRTPLNAINGMAYLIRRNGLPPEQMARLDKLESSGKHLLETINAVLDLSKIEAGKMVLEQTTFDLSKVIDTVLVISADRAASKQLQLLSELPAKPLRLIGDPTRLQQALLNFVGNGIKFTEAGSVSLRVTELESDQPGIKLRFEVLDTGIGIAPEAIGRLFNAFVQADGSMTRRFGGSGLGLVISKEIAEAMGGEAGVYSTPGVGSNFWMTACFGLGEAELPQDASFSVDVESEIRQRFSGRRVLLVEDEPINRELVQILLEESGLVIDIAEDGVDALELAASKQYDLILMDMQMPRMGGLEATRKIRQLAHGEKLRIIAMTANAFASDRAECMAAGMDDFIAKPVVPDQFFAILLKWLARSRS